MPVWQSDHVAGKQEEIFDVVVVGSANLDLVVRLDKLPSPGQTLLADGYEEHAGGKGLNQAVACARMGARTAFIGCVGDDEAGRMLTGVLRAEGVDVMGLRVVDTATGRAFISVDSSAENTIVVVPGANGSVGHDAEIVVPPCRLLLAQLEIPMETVASMLRQARVNGAITVLNPAPAMPLSPSMIADCDIISPNETESRVLGGADTLLGHGAGAVVLTLGADGAQIVTGTSTVHVDPFRVTPVDTVGAGDAFIGAMSAEMARGTPLHDACRVAAIAGALATTVHGAVPSLPTRTAVEQAAARR